MIQKALALFFTVITLTTGTGKSELIPVEFKNPPKDLTVTLPEDNWVAILTIIQNRNVKGVSMALDQSIVNNLIVQLNKQLPQDTTAKPKK